LLAAGVDPNKKNSISETALFIALENKNFAAASLLIQHGAKISLPDSSVQTSKPRHLSQEKCCDDRDYQAVVKYLFVTPLKTAAIGYPGVFAHDNPLFFSHHHLPNLQGKI
jgi:ankyrin repeat protein